MSGGIKVHWRTESGGARCGQRRARRTRNNPYPGLFLTSDPAQVTCLRCGVPVR